MTKTSGLTADAETKIRPRFSSDTVNAAADSAALVAEDIQQVLGETAAVLDARSAQELISKILTFLVGLPHVARGCAFSSESGDRLTPSASGTRSRKSRRFSIDQRLLKSALKTGEPQTQEISGREAAVIISIPLRSREFKAVFHIESDNGQVGIAAEIIGCAVNLIKIATPKLEALLLQERMRKLIGGAVSAVNSIIEAKDTYTSGHSERVGIFSQAIAREMGLSREQQENLIMSAVCHDIGKIGIPDAILKKPGLLSADEYEEMKAHPLIGTAIVAESGVMKEIVGGIRSHHERFDGTGYPDHLHGDAIPLFARVIAVADAVDAMTSGRSYCGYMSIEAAADQLIHKTDLFDPEVLAAFAQAVNKGSLSFRTGTRISPAG